MIVSVIENLYENFCESGLESYTCEWLYIDVYYLDRGISLA